MNPQNPIFIFSLALLTACSGKPEQAGSKARPAVSEPASATKDTARSGFETAIAGPAAIRHTLTLYGSIRPNAERRHEIRARYPGIIRTVAKRPGDAVAKGETLLSIESNDSLEAYPIRSPIAGTVLERGTNPGEAADGSQLLMVVADLSSMWVEFAVFTRDLAQVRAGIPVLLKADDGRQAETRITYVAPAGGERSQSVIARAVLDNRDRRWIAGQFATGEAVVAQVGAPVTVVPAALQQIKGETVVFVPAGTGFAPRPVELGFRDAHAVAIVKGLTAGERYVARGSYLAKAEVLKNEAGEE